MMEVLPKYKLCIFCGHGVVSREKISVIKATLESPFVCLCICQSVTKTLKQPITSHHIKLQILSSELFSHDSDLTTGIIRTYVYIYICRAGLLDIYMVGCRILT